MDWLRRLGKSRRRANGAPGDIAAGPHYVGYPGQFLVLIQSNDSITGVLPHFVRHSPGGFAWGYTGSGPADLARCVLIDVLGGARTCDRCTPHETIRWQSTLSVTPAAADDVVSIPIEQCASCEQTVPVLAEANYQRFKEEVVAVPDDCDVFWSVSQERVRDWLRDRGPDVESG